MNRLHHFSFCGAIDKWHFNRQVMQCHVEVSATRPCARYKATIIGPTQALTYVV